ncbi:MAG: AAA family ATPase [Spirochaetes bacterium]|nr:AAA family ATPase [Spirochaetota bacterium]
MASSKEIEQNLNTIQNWILISNKKNVLRGLEKLLGRGESVIDVLDGLYRGIKISGDRDLAGVLLATDRRILFVTSELSSPQYEELSFGDIRGIAFERAFSSIIITMKLKSTQVTFKTFDNRSAVTKFIDIINSKGDGAITPREDSTLRILDEINSTMKTLEEMNRNIISGAPTAGEAAGAEIAIDDASLEFLYKEAKKINRTIAELMGQVNNKDFKDALANDIILLSSLCGMPDGALSPAELIFISLVLMPLNPDGSTATAALAGEIFWGDSFPPDRKGDLISYWNSISGYIKKTKPGLDLEGYSLKTMNLLENLDRETGARHADRAGTALYTFAQCLMKADGTLSPEEEERLKQIHKLIYRGTAVSSTAVAIKEAEEEETLEKVMEKINALVGMGKIKEQIATLVNLIKVQKEREERKLPATPLSLHAVFYGPPGTGKTTIARLLGKVYKSLGLLKRGQLVETDRAGLVAGYVGQTAINVDNVVQKALDGVLFIDEAYALIPDDIGGKDFGQEAVNTILKRMEDYRERLVVIVAGYTEEMDRFILSNPGLKSRFSRYFYFDHYKPEELIRIFDSFCKNAEFRVPDEARSRALALFATLYEKRDRTFGNGRAVRNIFERIVERQANRIAGISPLTDEILCTIAPEDIPEEKDLIG